MPDFLIHRDGEGLIVRAIPYENIMMMDIEDSCMKPSDDWRVEIMLPNGYGVSIATNQADAERFLAEWREWWEKKERQAGRYTVSGTMIGGANTTAARRV